MNNLLEVHQFKKDFINEYENSERYAIMNANTFKECVGYKRSSVQDPKKLEGLLKITKTPENKSIYRKYRYDPEVKDGQILLSLTARSELGLNGQYRLSNKWKVEVKTANWFCYYWCNSDSSIKKPFRWAFCGVIMTLVSLALTIIQFICKL